jgi:predicted RNase H-like nuclease
MVLQLIGVDCATKDAKIGLARATFADGRVTLERALVCGPTVSAADTIGKWIAPHRGQTLLAIDAPLGWPRPLSQALATHRAGEEVGTPADAMFRRTTDQFIRRELGKTPLDVGADRIARTAHAALKILGLLRRRMNDPVPLAWAPTFADRLAAIEVYPAATLVAHSIRSDSYKERKDVVERREIIRALSREIELAVDEPVLEDKPDALDAAVCLLAGKDFLVGRAMPPEDGELARFEGWIWAARNSASKRA